MESLGHDYVIRITTDKPLNAETLSDAHEAVMLALGGVVLATTGEADVAAKPYVVQYRDPSGWRWVDLDEHRYDARGAALIARDKLNEDQAEVFPGITANLHRVVDMQGGAIVEWSSEAADQGNP